MAHGDDISPGGSDVRRERFSEAVLAPRLHERGPRTGQVHLFCFFAVSVLGKVNLTPFLVDPVLGDVIEGTGGLRKVRVAAKGRGKRGGARVIYYHVSSAAQSAVADLRQGPEG